MIESCENLDRKSPTSEEDKALGLQGPYWLQKQHEIAQAAAGPDHEDEDRKDPQGTPNY